MINSRRPASTQFSGSPFLASAEEAGKKILAPFEPDWAKAAYHVYVIQVKERGRLQQGLNEAGLRTGIHNPVPLHQQSAYTTLGYRRGDLPMGDRSASETVSLPLFPRLSAAQQKMVPNAVLASDRQWSIGVCRDRQPTQAIKSHRT